MYSEALRIMDENTVKYMIDELKEALSLKDYEISKRDSKISKMDSKISKMDSEISKKDSEIEMLRAKLAKYEDSLLPTLAAKKQSQS